MSATRLVPISRQPNQTQFGPSTDYAIALPHESVNDTLIRAAAGNATIIDVVDPNSVVGSYSYSFSHPGQDFNAVPFADSPAPDLSDGIPTRTKPRLLGNHYDLDNQTALNTMLLGRFQPFSCHFSKLLVWGGENFADATEKSYILTRGWNAIGESTPNHYQFGTNKVSILFLGVNGYAHYAADAITNYGVASSDPEYRWLVGMRDHGQFIDDLNATILFARAVFAGIMADSGNVGITSFCPDFEDASVSPYSSLDFYHQSINFTGYLCEGFRRAALLWNTVNTVNLPVPMAILYDHGNLSPISYFIYDVNQTPSGYNNTDIGPLTYSDPEPPLPLYFNRFGLNTNAFGGGTSKTQPIGNTNPLTSFIQQYGGYVGQTEYMRYCWDDSSYFQKNTDGSYKTVTVQGITNFVYRADHRTAVVNGQSTPMVSFDAYYQTNMRYTRIQQAITEWYFRAGSKHNAFSTDRQSGWEKLKLACWYRMDLEYKNDDLEGYDIEGDGIHVGMNHRTHNNEELELDVIVQYLLRDCLRIFMAAGQSILVQGQLAQTGTMGASYNPNFSKTPYETATKALHRWSEFNWLFDTTYQIFTPYLYMSNQRTDTGTYNPTQAFEKKPVIIGVLVPNLNGHTYLGLIWSYPTMDYDAAPIDLILWGNRSGTKTPAYKVHLTRFAGLDFWQLPDGFGDLTPSQLLFQFTDMTGVKQTVTGNYVDQASATITVHPTPPLLAN